MDEITKAKARFAQQIEDGKRIEGFTGTSEWSWYVDHVVKPTIDEYTERILSGSIPSDKEDWIMRGMIMGMRLVIQTPETMKQGASDAKKKAKDLQDYLNVQ